MDLSSLQVICLFTTRLQSLWISLLQLFLVLDPLACILSVVLLVLNWKPNPHVIMIHSLRNLKMFLWRLLLIDMIIKWMIMFPYLSIGMWVWLVKLWWDCNTFLQESSVQVVLSNQQIELWNIWRKCSSESEQNSGLMYFSFTQYKQIQMVTSECVLNRIRQTFLI